MDDLKSVDTFDGNGKKFEVIRGNKKPIITFSKLNKYFLIPFFIPIFSTLSDYFDNGKNCRLLFQMHKTEPLFCACFFLPEFRLCNLNKAT